VGEFDKYGIALSDPNTDGDADDYTDAGGICLVAGAGGRGCGRGRGRVAVTGTG